MPQANYFDSTLLGYQARVNPVYNEAELRELNSETLAVGLNTQKYLYGQEEIESIKESEIRPVYGYQYVRKASTGGTALAAFHTGPQGSSQQVALSWVAFTEEFSINLSTGLDNILKFQDDFDNEMNQAQRALRERIRVYIMTSLHSNRTAYSIGAGLKNATWNPLTDTYEISDKDKFWAKVVSVMHQNKYQGQKFDVFTDPLLYTDWDFTIAQGVGNFQNLAYQGKQFNNVWEDITLGNQVAEEYDTGTAIVLPQNAFTVIPWLPKTNRVGWGDFNSYAGGYGVVGDGKGLPLDYAVHGWVTQADTSGSHGRTQDVVMQFQVGVYIAVQYQVISNAGETPIYQFAKTA